MIPGRLIKAILLAVSLGIFLIGVAYAFDNNIHVVKPGETLWSITEKYYGDRSLWPKLWEVNRYNTANPHQISVGDKLNIYPMEKLMRAPAPPAPSIVATQNPELYDRGDPLDMIFPKYFTFLADPAGIGGTGVNRIKVKKVHPVTGQTIITYDEVREVGMIIASRDRGWEWDPDRLIQGKLMLSYHDDVIIRCTEDLAKVFDSATHEDPDPYFREFPIYGYARYPVREPDPRRVDYGNYVGELHRFKGTLKIVARVETLAPGFLETSRDLAHLKRHGLWDFLLSPNNQDVEPVSYVAKIIYSDEPIKIGDRIFTFKSLHPGPDRENCEPVARETGNYRPLGP